MWNAALTRGNSAGNYTRGTTGGEVTALYTTPTCGQTALSQYGVKAMDQLFTLYSAANPATILPVTTSNSTLNWQYVASGLPDGSGGAGLAASGPYSGDYYVQLDSSGGGVVAPVPEPGTIALLGSGLVGLLAYAWRKRKTNETTTPPSPFPFERGAGVVAVGGYQRWASERRHGTAASRGRWSALSR